MFTLQERSRLGMDARRILVIVKDHATLNVTVLDWIR